MRADVHADVGGAVEVLLSEKIRVPEGENPRRYIAHDVWGVWPIV